MNPAHMYYDMKPCLRIHGELKKLFEDCTFFYKWVLKRRILYVINKTTLILKDKQAMWIKQHF